MSDNSIWHQLENQLRLRMTQHPASLDASIMLSGQTVGATPKVLHVRDAQTAGLDVNSVPYYTTDGAITVNPSTVVIVEGTTIAMRTDTLAVHHLSQFAFSVFRPASGNMVVAGELGTTDFTATTPAIAGANPANRLISGTAAHAAWTVGTNGVMTLTVTGATSQTIEWLCVLDKVRAFSMAV